MFPRAGSEQALKRLKFDRWDRRQSRQCWSTVKPSFLEVLVTVATIGLMTGVCYVRDAPENSYMSPRHSHIESRDTQNAALQAAVTVDVHPLFGVGKAQSQALANVPPLPQQTSIALYSKEFGSSSTWDKPESHGSNAQDLKPSSFPSNCNNVLDGSPDATSIDMTQALSIEFPVPEAGAEPAPERLQSLPEVQLDRALAFAVQSRPTLQPTNCTWCWALMQGQSTATPLSLDLATGALAVISLLILLVSFRKVLRTGSSRLAQHLRRAASRLKQQVLFALGWAAAEHKPTHNGSVGAASGAEHVASTATLESPLSIIPRLMHEVVHLPLGLRNNSAAILPQVALGPIAPYLAGPVNFELRLPNDITFQAGALSGSSQASIMAVLPTLLEQHHTTHAMYNWPQICIASSVDSLNPVSMTSPGRTRANCLSTYHSESTIDHTPATKPVTASCGTHATLACPCDLAHQLEGKCREVQQLQIAKGEQTVHMQSQDATVSTVKKQLQAVSLKRSRAETSLDLRTKQQELFRRDYTYLQEQYLTKHHMLQDVQTRHNELSKNYTMQAASTKRAEERAGFLASMLQSTQRKLSCAERVARAKCDREFASSFAALNDVKDRLDRDRQVLSEAEVAVNADKHSMAQRAATARHQVQRTMAKQAEVRAELSARSHQVVLAGAASMVMMTHAQELQQQCNEQLSEVQKRHADLDAVQECQEYETKALGIKERELRELSGTLWDVRVDLEDQEAAFAAKEKLCLQELAAKRSELDAEAESKGEDLTAREAVIKAHEEQVHTAQQQLEGQQQQLASHHIQLQQAEAALTASMAAHQSGQAAPCVSDLQAAHQDLLQRKQALDVWQDQLAKHADTLVQQKQSLDQQRMTSSAGMNSSMADQLHCQRTDLEQRAAEVLHQKEQEWMRHLASAQQDALQQLQQTQQEAQQELQQKQQAWKDALAAAQQIAQQALQQKQQELDASRATAHHHAQQTVDDAVKRSADALQDAVAAAQQAQQEAQQAKQEAQQELQEKQQEWKAAFAIAQQSADQALQQKQQEVDASRASAQQTVNDAHHAQQTVNDAVKRSADALQDAVAAAQQEAQQAKQEAQQELHDFKQSVHQHTQQQLSQSLQAVQQAAQRQQQLTASLQAAQQLAKQAEAQAKHAQQETAAWRAQASNEALRLDEVQQKLQQVLQSQQQQSAEPCATRCDGTNTAGGGSSSLQDQALADKMAGLCSKQRPIPSKPAAAAAAASSTPAADNLPIWLNQDDLDVSASAKFSVPIMTPDHFSMDMPDDAVSIGQMVKTFTAPKLSPALLRRTIGRCKRVKQIKISAKLSAKLQSAGLVHNKHMKKSTKS